MWAPSLPGRDNEEKKILSLNMFTYSPTIIMERSYVVLKLNLKCD